ncbi:hypothetical protein [Tenacibaculum piscium]|uniref:hypothetical protein n=1 Tax=Tenacibaculum piscium TaxID=1458515 RepID=UPI001F42B19E|nr:hypothetical protein [Tenacibaculum piscium]
MNSFSTFSTLFISLILGLFIITSCDSSSELQKDFTCQKETFYNENILKKQQDFRKYFTTYFPENWKVNLYYDTKKTSIYAADTTVSLTETTLIDVTLVHKTIFIDNTFAQKITEDNKKMGFTELKTKHLQFLKKPSYYSYAKGKKGNHSYHILNTFTKINTDNFLHVKTEVYGDSLVEKRFCKAIELIEKININ